MYCYGYKLIMYSYYRGVYCTQVDSQSIIQQLQFVFNNEFIKTHNYGVFNYNSKNYILNP